MLLLFKWKYLYTNSVSNEITSVRFIRYIKKSRAHIRKNSKMVDWK